MASLSQEDTISDGILAARVAATAGRIASGSDLDDIDRVVLYRAYSRLREQAQVAEFGESDGQHGHEPSGVASLSLARGVVGAADGSPLNGTAAEKLNHLAEQIRELADTLDPALAKRIVLRFRKLAADARRLSGSTGETVIDSE